MINVQWENVQGIMLRGYPDYKFGVHLMMKFGSDSLAKNSNERKSWLDQLLTEITFAKIADQSNKNEKCIKPIVDDKKSKIEQKNENTVQFVAFTASGFKALGWGNDFLKTFPIEFQEGMNSKRCAETLGDTPEEWDWGGPNNSAVHMLLIIYSKTKCDLTYQVNKFCASSCVEVVKKQDATFMHHEHFGFRDGISQPVIDGTYRSESRNIPERDIVKPGEFVLGYVNEIGGLALSPSISCKYDPFNNLPVANVLATNPETSASEEIQNRRDFGKNGTYLVLRQLEQKVNEFDEAVEKIAKSINPEQETEDSNSKYKNTQLHEWVAAKLMGRWKNGRSITLYPELDGDHKPDVKNAEKENDFSYAKDDAFGYGCPIGSHVRRSNPRDTIAEEPKKSEAMVKRHRILRRGRLYGIEPDCEQCGYKSDNNYDKKGIMFMCLNAKIERQFEFIQQSWLNQSKFQGVINEVDPISAHSKHKTPMTIQANPIRIRTEPLDRFVTVRGGAYFFLPGKKALENLAQNISETSD